MPRLIRPEPECCDGSDEAPGVCPNKCKEIGEAHRKQAEAERKIRKTVSATAFHGHLFLDNDRVPKFDQPTLYSLKRRRSDWKTRLFHCERTWQPKKRKLLD